MATVHVFVGQCGNQLGSSFLDAISLDAESSPSEAYQMLVSSTHFRPAIKDAARENGMPSGPASQGNAFYLLSSNELQCPADQLPQPRCVMVDMEPKVIEQTIARTNNRIFSGESGVDRRTPYYSLTPQQCVARGEGSGNNWAFGYFEQGESCRERIGECLRRESEVLGTSVTSYHVLHSIAGGTGSGVGCLVADTIKEMFPRASLLHSIVWPFECGEVATQWYNVVLAMSALRDTVDGAFIAFNDVFAAELAGTTANRGLPVAGQVTFERINDSISKVLTPLHLPQLLFPQVSPHRDPGRNQIGGGTIEERRQRDATQPKPMRLCRMQDVIEALSLDPVTKYFTGVSVPSAPAQGTSWSAVLNDAARSSVKMTFTTDLYCGASTIRRDVVRSQCSAYPFPSRACLWALRGPDAQFAGIRELQHVLATSAYAPLPYTSTFVSPMHVPSSSPVCSSHNSVATDTTHNRPSHEVTLYGPSPMIATHLEGALQRTEELLNEHAFLHHFEKYGVGKDDLLDATARVWEMVAAYSP